ncbi:FAD-dependent oxidoreductase [Nocardioides sp. Leaf285]|uniref:FAD-dependent oxidoreductase n=1 Tax=Nocardioides sp. Leaf285 TaxID=1736322 RepID=UPI0007030383|nr:FAD-dependent oxidoreductase [Nocardioides sp. Leaf285]KQP63566.1 dehydrogenase [Nocardioides sp. Leaf285]
MTPRPTRPERIAVVGSGVAGLTAAYVASRTAHVTLYEADERLGGHADTHDVLDPATGRTLGIDTGFIVHNRRTYPVLLRLLAELGVATQESEMSMSIRDDDTGLEWAGALGRRGVFPRRDNLTRPAYLRMLTEIPRFHRRAKALLAAPDTGVDQPLRDFLAEGGFSAYFTRHFMEPLVAAVWSCDPEVALDYPARYLFTFLQHHGMLSIFGSPTWRTVSGGSREYVRRVGERIQEVRLGAKVTSVLETPSGVEVTDGNGEVATYDAVVVATHPGQALALLAEPTPAQRELLGAMPYSPNTALLHTDLSLMPTTHNAWASWNFQRPAADAPRPDGSPGVVVTYDLTRLQRLDTDTHYLVTLGGEHLVDPASVIERMEYEHPLYNPTSVAAQQRLRELDSARLTFAGAYHGWGFHEDGARSGLAAVERLGLEWPAEPDAQPRVETPVVYDTTIRHTRRRPFARSFTHASHTWLVDLDELPDHGRRAVALGSFEARDHLGSPGRSIRENLEAFLAGEGVTLPAAAEGGRVLMAAQPRAFGYCFNPISVFWCLDRSGRRVATVVEVHNTYGDRHAYLVDPDEQGRARTDKAMYVSPFHGTDGHYELAVPVPDERLRIAVTLHSDDGAVFSASLDGRRSGTAPWRAAPAALRGSVLIRAHGVWLWLRRLPIRPRPQHVQPHVQPGDPTPTHEGGQR